MAKIIGLSLSVVITSLFFFPFSLVGVPFFNTKMIMALLGLVVYLVTASRRRIGGFPTKYVNLSIYAAVFSVICFFAVTFNNTTDYAYATYIASMWVWMSGAYFACHCIKVLYGEISFKSVCDILILVCVVQCCLALLIDNNVALKMWVDAHIEQGQDFLTDVKRIYGIGASLDVAGTRFAAVLILIAHVLTTGVQKMSKWHIPLYLAAFAWITVTGNMIARTTSVGVVLGLIYMIFKLSRRDTDSEHARRVLTWFVAVVLIAIPISVYFYNTNPATMKLFRFAFEGFFNYFEKGEWSIASNEKLGTMVVFPETMKTWLIGDGYFSNPRNTDPYFIGVVTGGYYMGTDVGYLRFIFYCGMIGLLAFSAFIIRCAHYCTREYPEYKLLFWCFALLNFIIWLKVSTDIFLVFALFLVIKTVSEENEDEKSIAGNHN